MISDALSAVLVDRIGWLLIHSLWQFTLLALAMALVLRMMRGCSAAARYWTCLAALTAVIVTPAVTWRFLPADTPQSQAIESERGLAVTGPSIAEQPALPAAAMPAPELSSLDPLPTVEMPIEPIATPLVTTDATQAEPSWSTRLEAAASPWLEELVAFWCLGVLLFALRPLWSWYTLHRLRRVGVSAAPESVASALERTAERLGVRRRVRVLQSTRAAVPMVVGYLRPVILLPVCVVSGLSAAEVEAILAHELAHIRRHDYLVNLLQTLLETVCFYHPAVWWLSSRLRHEREHCCDTLAAQTLGNRAAYGRALLALEELRSTPPVLSLGANTGSLLERIRRLAQVESNSSTVGAGGAIGLGLLAVSLFSLTMWVAAIAGDSPDGPGSAETSKAVSTDQNFADSVADRFAAALERQNLPFVGKEESTAFRREMHEYLAARVQESPPEEVQSAALQAVDDRVSSMASQGDAYLHFREQFDMLCWQLWALAERRELTPEEIAIRDEQREWMREYIRGLPAIQRRRRIVEWEHEARVQVLEGEVFGNSLSPFFRDPMPPDEFTEFEKLLLERQGTHADRLIYAPAHIFYAAVTARAESLQKRWPPGFAVSGLSISNEDEFSFRRDIFARDTYLTLGNEGKHGRPFFDVKRNITINQPVPLDEESTRIWLSKNDEGDLWYDPHTGRLIPVHGAKLATVDETEWHAVDQIPLADLRRRAAESPIDSFSVAELSQLFQTDPGAADDAARQLPTLVLESAHGDVVVIRVKNLVAEMVFLMFRPRPLPPNPPFHLGETLIAKSNGTGESSGGADSTSQRETAGDSTRDERREAQRANGVVQGVLIHAADGAPVSGARILLRGQRLHHAESDAEGRFRLEGVPPYPRQYELWARAGNLITPKVQVEQTIDEDSQLAQFAPLRLEMQEGQRVEFTVTSAVTGEPVEGAVVRFGYPDRRMVTTAVDGTAVVEGLHAQEYDVTIEAEGHARNAPQIDLSQAEMVTRYTAKLEAGGIVRGVVVDAQGNAVPETEVVYWIGDGVGFGGDAYRTDGEGRFQNRFLPLNTPVVVSFSHDAFERHRQQVLVDAEDRETDVRITLKQRPAGKALVGVVKDAEGNPVPGAHITNYGNRGNAEDEAVTDADGKFALDNMREGYTGYEIHVTAKGFAPTKLAVTPGTAESPGSVAVTLHPGHTLRGRVVDEDGKPANGAFVSTRSPAYPGDLGPTHRTAADGRFVFDSLPEDVVFDVSLPGYARMRQISLPLDSDEVCTIALEAPGQIRGRVVDQESDEPVEQFRVRVGFSRVRQPGDAQGTYDSVWGDPGLTFTSDEGEFLITPLKNGMPVELTILADGYERAVVPRAVAAVADRSEELTVSLTRIDTTARFTLAGQFLDHAGRPAAGAQLRLIVSTNQPTGRDDNDYNWALVESGQLGRKSYVEQFLSGVTDANGRFEFRDIRSGKSLQLAYWGEGIPKGRSLAFDETRAGAADSVTIKLPQPATIRGTITRSRFPDAGSVRLSLRSEAWHNYELELGEGQTTFAFDDLPPGEYDVSLAAKPVEYTEDGQTFYRISPLAGQKVELQPGETKDVSFTEPNVERR